MPCFKSPLALYKGALPPAIAWGASDSLLLGSLHNYRLFLIRNGFTEPIPGSRDSDARRLTVFGHGLAGLWAGWTGALLAHPMGTLQMLYQSYDIYLPLLQSRSKVELALFPTQFNSQPSLVKLQMQTQRDVKDRQYKGRRYTLFSKSDTDTAYLGLTDLIRQMYRVQGPFGIWRGFASSLVYRSSFCWMFSSYEVLMRASTLLNDTPLEVRF